MPVGMSRPTLLAEVEKRRQAVRDFPARKVFFARRVFKKGKFHVTRSGPEVIRLAHDVKRSIQPYARRVEIAGSVRRDGKIVPTDVDLVVIPKDKQKIAGVLRGKGRIVSGGEHKLNARIEGVDVNVSYASPEDYGAQLLRATGSYRHNIGLSALAKRRGLLLSQYGLFRGDRRIAGRTEREIYKKLGRPRFKQPWERG